MKWSQFMSNFPHADKIFLEIGKFRMVDLRIKDGGLSLCKNFLGASSGVMMFIPTLEKSAANMFEAVTVGRVLADGPKIFAPKQLELELMEEMNLNICMEDYVQPFDTVVIELPNNYVKNKKISCPQAGEISSGTLMPEAHEPVLVILHHRPEFKVVITQVIFSSLQSIKTALYPKPTEQLEEYMDGMYNSTFQEFENCDKSSIEELTVVNQVVRACMNYCLLLDEVGIRHVGADNPAYHDRLRRYVSVASKKQDRDKIQNAVDNLTMHPQRYQLKQEVKLCRTVNSHNELPEATGRQMPPHHRRGYYKMQPYGPNNSLRKRIRMKAVFVNKKFFLGELSDTEARYS